MPCLKLERHNQRRRELSARKGGAAGAAGEESKKAPVGGTTSTRTVSRRRSKRAAVHSLTAAPTVKAEAANSGASAINQPLPAAAHAPLWRQQQQRQQEAAGQGAMRVQVPTGLDRLPPEVAQALPAQLPAALSREDQDLAAMEVVSGPASILFCSTPCWAL